MEHTLQLGEILKDGMYPVESEGGETGGSYTEIH